MSKMDRDGLESTPERTAAGSLTSQVRELGSAAAGEQGASQVRALLNRPVTSDVRELGGREPSGLLIAGNEEEVLRELAYVIGHDLQAPVRALLGFSRLLADERSLTDQAKQTAYRNRIVLGSELLQSLLDDLVRYCKLGAGVVPSPTDVTAAAWAAIGEVPSASDRRAAVHLDDLPPALADRALLETVFQELIDNGLKFSTDQPVVDICGERMGAECIYSVSDRGMGIPEAETLRVFDIFRRLHLRADFDGNGIGLSLCRRALTRLGGRIWVESRPGGGSTFRFALPAATSTPQE